MIRPQKLIFRTMMMLIILYVLICILLYFFQEKLIFFPEKLDRNYRFGFSQPFREINIKTRKDGLLNGLLFHSDSSKKLVFYLHGNAGSLKNWGEAATRYTDLNCDVFMPDYPGYGKSEGSISSQAQLFENIQAAYDSLKTRYHEENIVILGYSIGTGPAAWLAANNKPKLLILQAPYYNLSDLMRQHYPFLPTFLLRYKFNTNEYIRHCKMPVIIFHGTDDEVIYYGSSLKLKNHLKPADTLITLKGQGHNGITDNAQYIQALARLLD